MLRIEEMGRAAADLESALHQVARLQNSLRVDDADDRIDRVFLETLEFTKLAHRYQLPIDEEGIEPLSFGPTSDLGVKTLACFDERREHLQRPASSRGLHLPNDFRDTLFFHR